MTTDYMLINSSDNQKTIDCIHLIQNAFSQNVEISIDTLTAIALSYSQVLAVRAFEVEDCFVFAILTKPIYLKSERDSLKEELTMELMKTIMSKNYNNTYNESSNDNNQNNDILQNENTFNVIVTFDNEVYRSINSMLSDEEKLSLMQKAELR